MSDSRRQVRVERELQQLIAKFLVKGFKLPLKGLVSVSRVVSTPEISTAKVYVSVLGSEQDRDYSMDILNEGLWEIQKHVNKQMRMKFVPRLSIHLDQGMDKYLSVEKKLRDLDVERQARGPIGESSDPSGEDE